MMARTGNLRTGVGSEGLGMMPLAEPHRMVDDCVTVGHGGDYGKLVAYEYDCSMRGHLLENRIDMLFEMLVEIAEGLVEHEHFRTRYQSSAEQGALQLAAGKIADRSPAVVGKLHHA